MSSSFLDVRQPVTSALLLRPDTKDCEELAATVMIIVDCIKIELSTDVLKGILRPVVERVEEISWPPRNPKAINQMEMAKENKDKPGLAGKLQKVLQLYPATILSKHSYAKKGTFLKSLAHSKLPSSTNRISSRLHPITGNEVVKAEHFLETLIKDLFMQPYFPCSQSTQRSSHLVYYVFPAHEEQWNNGLSLHTYVV
ncbi:hypothetical protein F2Q69_00044437 [Brassica cretica]|uniref:Uncharacterized protein n=1 Tax=Brassica cretica TaxID=69181 RepID=A0A8S9NRU7_BRACR|nr:hypothetical protein F2Q69_00044437 [Brassica cretica]